jgi:hypothetical protein
MLFIIFITCIIILLYIKYLNYLPTHYIEHSIKFNQNTKYNNHRKIYIYINFINKESLIFDTHNINQTLREFYFKNHKNPIELILGNDNNKQKIYFCDKNKVIYGLVKDNNTYEYREYKPINNFKKNTLDTFLGKELSNKLYKIINNYFKKKFAYEKYVNKTITSYHLYFRHIQIKHFETQIHKLLKLFNCNTTNINSWIQNNKEQYIYWIGITKKNNQFEITFYYRSYLL